MTLNQSRLIVRYYFFLVRAFGDEDSVRWRMARGTSLCLFVWRIIFCTLFLLAGAAAFLSFVTLLIKVAFDSPLDLLIVLAITAAATGGVAAAVLIAIGLASASKSNNIAITYVKAIKRGICPLVTFTNTAGR